MRTIAAEKPLYGPSTTWPCIGAVDTLEHGASPEPAIALLVSGGYCRCCGWTEALAGGVVPLGATIDDAAGEAYDKWAGYRARSSVGDRRIDQAARDGDPGAIAFPQWARPRRRTSTRTRSTSPFSGFEDRAVPSAGSKA